MRKSLFIKTSGLGIIIAGTFLLHHASLLNPAQAQILPATQILFSWHANNFYPSDFSGKPLPTTRTPVTISVQLIQNKKIVGISNAAVLWYVDEKLVSRETGVSEITFTATKREADYHTIRVVVDRPSGEKIEAATRIPVGKRSLSLHHVPSPSASPLPTLAFEAVPFFFNISSLNDLNFFWYVDKVAQPAQSGNRLILPIEIGEGVPEITVSAQNPTTPLEFGTGKWSGALTNF